MLNWIRREVIGISSKDVAFLRAFMCAPRPTPEEVERYEWLIRVYGKA